MLLVLLGVMALPLGSLGLGISVNLWVNLGR